MNTTSCIYLMKGKMDFKIHEIDYQDVSVEEI